MREIEELLRQDRASAPMPEPPDPRYTAAAVRRRLTPDRSVKRDASETRWLSLGGTVLVGATGLGAVQIGLHPAWLFALPLLALPTLPILLRKGAPDHEH